MNFRLVINMNQTAVKAIITDSRATVNNAVCNGWTEVMLPHTPARLKKAYATLKRAFPYAEVYAARIWDDGRAVMLNTAFLEERR